MVRSTTMGTGMKRGIHPLWCVAPVLTGEPVIAVAESGVEGDSRHGTRMEAPAIGTFQGECRRECPSVPARSRTVRRRPA